MIQRTHTKGDTTSVAVYSDCERYRYSLKRIWELEGPPIMFLMLNPSTATEVQNDPTVERCERRARALGYGAVSVTNIFALRATDPTKLYEAEDPIGRNTDGFILGDAHASDCVVAAWGTHGAHLDRGPTVERLLRAAGHGLFHLGLSKAGHPKHPLYIAYDRQPEIWER